MRMYGELARWWPLLSPPEEYADEAEQARALLLQAAPGARTLLELGSGGGNNASHLKQWFEMTLVDLSEDMLAVSRGLNPECAHAQGDMRTVRLGTAFDTVFVHDAICYMTTEDDLRASFETVIVHLKPGGAVLFAPDWVKDTFEPGTDDGGCDGPEGGLRFLEWSHDPDPTDTTYTVDYAIMVKDARGDVRVVHDRHVEGLFPIDTWLRLLQEAGFKAECVPDTIEPARRLFVGQRVA